MKAARPLRSSPSALRPAPSNSSPFRAPSNSSPFRAPLAALRPRSRRPHPPVTARHHRPAMATMAATHGHGEACCNVPPVVSKGYTPKGAYEEIGGYKTYVTGPADATKALVVIYDIFGYMEQTLQGADMLAYGDETQKYRVLMPDWFKGKPIPIEWYPPKTEEKKKSISNFFATYPPPQIAGCLPDYVKAAKEKSASVAKFGIIGYCWGGKVVALTAKAASNPFSVAAAVHPAMVDPADASGIKVPMALLASKDESPEDVKKFEAGLTGAKHVETFADQIHGWMAARSDLSNSRVREEYERGYKTLLVFLCNNF